MPFTLTPAAKAVWAALIIIALLICWHGSSAEIERQRLERRGFELEAYIFSLKQQLAASKDGTETCNTAKASIDKVHLDCSRATASDAFVHANVAAASDKVPRNGYHEAYGPMLTPYMHIKGVRILEIGVQNGNSLDLWKRLFPEHEVIVGVAYGVGDVTITNFKTEVDERTILYQGDQSDSNFWRRLEQEQNKFDVIIDDGSHIPWHQIFTLEQIFKSLLTDGGIYVIEDVETSYWDSRDPIPTIYDMYEIPGAGVGTHGSAVEKLKLIPEVMNRKFMDDPDFSVLRGKVDHLFASITFSRNCAVIVKKDSVRWEAIDRDLDGHLPRYRPSALDPQRTLFKAFQESASWSVTGTQNTTDKVLTHLL